MPWILLIVAGLFEVGWAIGLKYTEGFTRPLPTVLTVVSMVISLGLLGLALRDLPVGTAYAVWTGVGAVGTAALGIMLFGDPATAAAARLHRADRRRHRRAQAGRLTRGRFRFPTPGLWAKHLGAKGQTRSGGVSADVGHH